MHDTCDIPATFTGQAAAPGRVVGPAFHWPGPESGIPLLLADPSAALRQALAGAHARLTAALVTADATLAPLLDAQRLMLDDPDFRDGALELVAAGGDLVDAVLTVAGQLAALLEGADSAYFRERAIDVRAVGTLVAATLRGEIGADIPRGAVVLAEELAPLDTARLAEAGVAALVTVRGGPTCHAAIMARAWGIPAVVGAPDAVLRIAEGAPVLVDGADGAVIVHPTPAQQARQRQPAVSYALSPRIPIYANIGSLAEAERAVTLGAEGIGLLRTEFLFQGRQQPPSEEAQVEAYTAILRCMAGRPLVVRTLDIGADKPVPFLPTPPEANPQLGLRGIRLCLQQRELFCTQLRALLRVSVTGPLKIMLPMVTTVEEMRETCALLAGLADTLGVALPPCGAMIEVPMAALAAPELATVCDFFSLGTNDLLQFLLAADRQHAGVGYLHAGEHPAVWRLIAPVIAAAHAASIPVGVCGEWGADPEKLARLLGLGVDTVSVAVGALPQVRALFA
ncbi:MAG TPA: phosphoenolpyruvate--protein phosphotransferase [Armatimonadota bacterium]|jgi:phosphoenolpyruvate-protein phosphotransferase